MHDGKEGRNPFHPNNKQELPDNIEIISTVCSPGSEQKHNGAAFVLYMKFAARDEKENFIIWAKCLISHLPC